MSTSNGSPPGASGNCICGCGRPTYGRDLLSGRCYNRRLERLRATKPYRTFIQTHRAKLESLNEVAYTYLRKRPGTARY